MNWNTDLPKASVWDWSDWVLIYAINQGGDECFGIELYDYGDRCWSNADNYQKVIAWSELPPYPTHLKNGLSKGE